MIFVKISIVFIIVCVFPYCLGKLMSDRMKLDYRNNLIHNYAFGFFMALALFQLVCVPMTYLYVSFRVLVCVYTSIILLICIYAIYKGKKVHMKCNKFILSKYELIYLLFFLILLGVQIYHACFYDVTYVSLDDYDYIATANAAQYDNGMFLTNFITGEPMKKLWSKRTLNSYVIFMAYLAEVSGFHVTTVAHTILPIFLLILAYGTYYLIAVYLFKDRENRFIFLGLISIVNIFSEYTVYSITFRLLGPIWQGKSIVMVIVIPFLFAVLPVLFNKEYKNVYGWYLLIISTAACSFSLMGVGMSLIVVGAMAIIYFILTWERKYIYYVLWGGIVPMLHMILYFALK